VPIVSALFGAGFTVGVSIAFGFLLLRRLRLGFHRLEATLFAFVAGAACQSLAVFLLCVIHQARTAAFLTGGLAVMIAAVWQQRREAQRPALPALPPAWRWLFAAVFAAFFACYLFNAVAPEISPDGSGYHLGNVARFWRYHGFAWDYHSIYSSLSQGIEMLFLVAYLFGRHPAAALVHMAFQTTLPLLLVCYGQRFAMPRAGAFAAILVYACPVVGIDGISAYNDVAVATLLFAVFYLLQVWNEDQRFTLLILIGLLCGLAAAVKYTAILALPFALGFAGWAKSTQRISRRVLAVALGATIMFGPWLIRNWIWLGNPAAPFLNRWFPNPYWTAAMERDYLDGLAHYPTVKFYWSIPYQLIVTGGLVPGLLGPVFLLAPLALFALRSNHGRRLLLAGLVFSIPAWFNTEVRFLIPALPFFALAMGIGIPGARGALPAAALFHALLSWPSILTLYCDRNAWRLRSLQVKAALRREPESSYIGSHIADYALKPAIEREVAPNERIFSFAGRAAAYLNRDIIVGYESTLGVLAQETLEKAAGTEQRRQAALKVKSLGLQYLLVNDSDQVAQDMRHNTSLWGLTELAEANGIRLYRIP